MKNIEVHRAPRCQSQTKLPPIRWKTVHIIHDESISDQEVILNQSHVQQVVPSMFLPYIEGPKMDWTVNDGLYNRYLKWRLKCKNTLECELAGRRKCKKVITWSGDFGIDQYVSWNLTNEKPTLDVIWEILRNSVNHNLMRSEQELTFLQALVK